MLIPVLLSVGLLCVHVHGHGRLIDPPSRSSMWRYGFNNPPNYDDNQLYCGGAQVQWVENGGKCGVCGDPWPGPRENEAGGKYANGIIVRKYEIDQVIKVVVELTANHKGWMEFRLCPNNDPRTPITHECLNRYLLRLAETGRTRYIVPTKGGYHKLKINLRLPAGLKCKNCVLQWKYNAGNSWGTDALTGRSCVGCGPQEQFYGCADVAIGYDNVAIPQHKTLPADIEDDDDGKATPPPVFPPDHNWNRDSNTEEDGDRDKSGMPDASQQVQTDWHFMPNNKEASGMSPCMCLCKKSSVKLQGGKDGNIQVNMFEGHDDKQVCMCMCQPPNSSTNFSFSRLLYSVMLLISLLFCFLLRR